MLGYPLVLPQAIFTVEAIHEHYIDKDQDQKYVDGSLLGKPEPQLEPKKLKLIEPVNEEDPGPERYEEPDCEQRGKVGQVCFPVGIHGERRKKKEEGRKKKDERRKNLCTTLPYVKVSAQDAKKALP